MTQPQQQPLCITCADGLETLLAQELEALGATLAAPANQPHAISSGRVWVLAEHATVYRIALWSRLASRVLVPLFSEVVETKPHATRDIPEELYTAARHFGWHFVFGVNATIHVNVSLAKGLIAHSQFATFRVKDGIVDAFLEEFGSRPSVQTQQADCYIHVWAGETQHQFFLNITGQSLHKRGYRQYMTTAPIKENLAAAILRAAQWHARPYTHLIDPMCGSGTFIIEALHAYYDRAPNLLHPMAFYEWQGHDETTWQHILQDAYQRFDTAKQQRTPLQVFAFDADIHALNATRRNLVAAELGFVVPHIRLELRHLNEWPDFNLQPDSLALCVTNPPYGERIGHKISNKALYQGLSLSLQQRLAGHQAAVIAAQVEVADTLALADPYTLKLYNGALPIYLRLGTIKPWAAPMRFLQQWQAVPVQVEEGQDFANRLLKNMQQFKKMALARGISTLRIYDADLPDYNLAIDLYTDYVHVQEYAPPKHIEEDKAKRRFNTALHIIRQVLQVNREHVFIKTRRQQKGELQYEKTGQHGKRFIVYDGSIARALVNFTDYLDTGLFIDHRPLRERIATEAQGKHFLNLFCYTAMATVHAALGGAKTTTSVDLSHTYLDWAKENLSLNGIPFDEHSSEHRFIQGDVFEWLKHDQDDYDLIFLDPPTFSNSKRFKGTFDIQRDHVSLIKHAMQRLSDDGVLYFSNNYRKFTLDPILAKWFTVEDISEETLDFDFKRNAKIHRTWRLAHL